MTGSDDVVVLEAGGQRYAVELRAVERVHTVDRVTALPGLRPPWKGLVTLRGEILPALDLSSYLGRTVMAQAAVGGAVVAHGSLRVVLLSEAPVTLAPRAGGGMMLDVETILADPGLEVND